MARDSLRELPAVDRLLAHARTQALLARFSRPYVLRRCREILDELRREIKKGHPFEPGALGEERILDRLSQDHVAEALSAVPHDFRDVLVLVDIGDFTYAEAAQILDIPIGTVMSRLHRGRRILKQELAEQTVETA